jgi:hypothetical protein
MSGLTLEQIENGLVAAGVPRDRARTQALRECGLTLLPSAEQLERDDERDEKALVRETDKRMRAAGFRIANYSQPRASKQSAGVQDHEYFHLERGLFTKWEAKTPRGEQSPAQKEYQEWCIACRVPYLVGPPSVIEAWCQANGITLPPAPAL